MHKVAVPVESFVSGSLPRCCARHGVTATHDDRRRFNGVYPSWALILPVQIRHMLAYFLRWRVGGMLPACDACTRDRRRFIGVVLSVWGLDVVALVAVLADPVPAVLLVWVVLLFGAALLSFAGDRFRVRGLVSQDRSRLMLYGVADAFVSAVGSAPAVSQTPLSG